MFFSKVYSALYTAVFACSALALSSSAYAHEHHSTGEEEPDTNEIAYRLVNNFWRAVEHQNVQKYSRMLSHCFQGLNISGHYNREDQISGLENLTIDRYRIRDLIASRFGDTLVISYNLYATGEGIVPGPSIDVWHKENCSWKQVSHSYVPFSEPEVFFIAE